MKIDWKHVATTPGYKKLKAAYIHDVIETEKHRQKFGKKLRRDKKYFLGLFQWVINRAKHYAHHQNRPLEDVLNEWEAKRDYCWLNYYQEEKFPRLDSGRVRRAPMTLNRIRRIAKKFYRDPVYRKAYVFDWYMRIQKEQSTKNPQRWDMWRKKRFKRKSVR